MHSGDSLVWDQQKGFLSTEDGAFFLAISDRNNRLYYTYIRLVMGDATSQEKKKKN